MNDQWMNALVSGLPQREEPQVGPLDHAIAAFLRGDSGMAPLMDQQQQQQMMPQQGMGQMMMQPPQAKSQAMSDLDRQRVLQMMVGLR